MNLRQWDVIRVRINPTDRDEHPAVLVTADEFCLDSNKLQLNVLYGSTRRPGITPRPHHVVLNGADGLDHATVFSCGHLYTIDRSAQVATPIITSVVTSIDFRPTQSPK